MTKDTRIMTREILCCADCIFYSRLVQDDMFCHHPDNFNQPIGINLNTKFHPNCPLEKGNDK